REDGVPPEEHATTDADPLVGRTLGVEHAAIVHRHVVAEPDLPGMAERHVHAEGDVLATGGEEPGIEEPPQEQPQRPRHPGGEQHDGFVAEERPPAALADKEVLVALDGRATVIEERPRHVGEAGLRLAHAATLNVKGRAPGPGPWSASPPPGRDTGSRPVSA